jgi:hypothetical protein
MRVIEAVAPDCEAVFVLFQPRQQRPDMALARRHGNQLALTGFC